MNEPAIYFDTDHADDRAFADDLDLLAYDRGVTRLPGESDHELRNRIREMMYAPRRGSREDITRAVEMVAGVTGCRVTDVFDERDHHLDVDVDAEAVRPAHVIRGEIEGQLRAVVGLGIEWRVSIRFRQPRLDTRWLEDVGLSDEDLD